MDYYFRMPLNAEVEKSCKILKSSQLHKIQPQLHPDFSARDSALKTVHESSDKSQSIFEYKEFADSF